MFYPKLLAKRMSKYRNEISFGCKISDRTERDVLFRDGEEIGKHEYFKYGVIDGSYKLKLVTKEDFSLEEIVDEIMQDVSTKNVDLTRSDIELAVAVVLKGDIYDLYGNLYWNREFDVSHLFNCGIDWEKFRGVTASNWSNFADTEGPNDETQVLEASFVCKCGNWRCMNLRTYRDKDPVQFGLELPSLTDFFIKVSGSEVAKYLLGDLK